MTFLPMNVLLVTMAITIAASGGTRNTVHHG